MGKGIRRAAMAVFLAGSGPGFAQAGQTCDLPPPVSLIDQAALSGAPQIGRAVAELRAGHREEAIALLDQARAELAVADPEALMRHKGLPYSRAAINAGLASWLLRGCPAAP